MMPSQLESDIFGDLLINPTEFLPSAHSLLKTDRTIKKIVKEFVRHPLTNQKTNQTINNDPTNNHRKEGSTQEALTDLQQPSPGSLAGSSLESWEPQLPSSSFSWLKANYSAPSLHQQNPIIDNQNYRTSKPSELLYSSSKPSSASPMRSNRQINDFDDEGVISSTNFFQPLQLHEQKQSLSRDSSFRTESSSTTTERQFQIQTASSPRNRLKDTVFDVFAALPVVLPSSLTDQEEMGRMVSPGRRLQSRILAAEVTRLGGIASPPNQIDINGFLIPRGVMQESVVSLVRKQEIEHRKTGSVGKIGEQAFEDSVAGSLSTNNKTSSTNIYPAEYYKRKHIPEPPSVSLIHSNTDNTSEKFLRLTARSKISSIVSKGEEDYAHKWMQMKAKRDQEFHLESKLDKRKDLRHILQRIAINSDKDELQRVTKETKKQEILEKAKKKEEYHQRREQHEMILTKRLEKALKKKKQQVKEIKNHIKESIHSSQIISDTNIRNKLEYFRENHLANQFQRSDSSRSMGSAGSGVVDDDSSSIVHIPADIAFRVKTAKSLLQYEAAKKELKDYQDRTLSQRISDRARRYEAAVMKAQSLGTKVAIKDIRGSTLFSDSLSLDSEDLEERSFSLSRRSHYTRSPASSLGVSRN